MDDRHLNSWCDVIGIKDVLLKKAKAMDNEYEALYYKERNTKDDIIAIFQDRLNYLTHSYEQADKVLMYGYLGILGIVILIAIAAWCYFSRDEIDIVNTLTVAFMFAIGIISGFMAKLTMQRCFNEIIWYTYQIKSSTGFKVVGAHDRDDRSYYGLYILPNDNKAAKLNLDGVNWRSFNNCINYIPQASSLDEARRNRGFTAQ